MKFKNVKLSQLLFFIFPLILLLFPLSIALAQLEIDFLPSISITQEYNDNIYLNDNNTYLDTINKTSDYISIASPRGVLILSSQTSSMEMMYSPSFVNYASEDINNTTRHLASLTFMKQISQYWSINCSERYIKSEESVEDIDDINDFRSGRDSYQRNNGMASLSYLFGSENELSIGYQYSWVDNNYNNRSDFSSSSSIVDTERVDNATTQRPFFNIDYWFDLTNGLELDYEFVKAIFWGEEAYPGNPANFTGHSLGIAYKHRFRQDSLAFIRSAFTERNFVKNHGITYPQDDDHIIYELTTGLDISFLQYYSLAFDIGFFTQVNDLRHNESGIIYSLSLIKNIEHGRITVNGAGGWDELYLQGGPPGFSNYWSLFTRVDYQLLEPLTGYMRASFRHDKDGSYREWDSIEEGAGLKWNFSDNFSFSLDYSYAERDGFDDFQVNRVMLIMSADSLYRW